MNREYLITFTIANSEIEIINRINDLNFVFLLYFIQLNKFLFQIIEFNQALFLADFKSF